MTEDAPRQTLTIDGLRTAAADLPWQPILVVGSTGSTNADALSRAESGAPEGLVIAADEQTAGRGRLGRQWVSPPGASVSVSVLLRPPLQPEQLGWLPLLTGLAVAAGVRESSGTDTVLKWPNDVLVTGGRAGKIAGILLERSGTAAVIGFGINTAMTAQELPVAEASSIVLAGGAAPDPDRLVASCLGQLQRRYAQLVASGGDPVRSGLAQEYRAACGTVGREVVVALPSGEELRGVADRVDDLGRLCVLVEGQLHPVAAGDVVHLR